MGLDSLNFLEAVRGLPEQIADAHVAARDALRGASLPAPVGDEHRGTWNGWEWYLG